MFSHGSNVYVYGSNAYVKAYILESNRTWHIQQEFSDCICDMCSSDTKITSSQEDATKTKSKQFSGFGSQTIMSFVVRYK